MSPKALPAEIASFLDGIANPERREDSNTLYAMMSELTGLEPRVWSGTMIGFGRYKYRYASGRSGEWFRIGFSPRAQGMSLYLMSDFAGEEDLMQRIGKHKMGKCCMTFKRLADLHEPTLRELIAKSARGAICAEAKG